MGVEEGGGRFGFGADCLLYAGGDRGKGRGCRVLQTGFVRGRRNDVESLAGISRIGTLILASWQ